MVAVRAKVFVFKVMARMNLRDRTADFAFKLATFFAVIKPKILSRGRACFTNGIIRDFGLRIFNIDGF